MNSNCVPGRLKVIEYGVVNCDYSDGDKTWCLDKFLKNVKIRIVKYNKDDIEFDIVGIHAAVANAFRRVLIAELPSMAIEKVYMYNNTSIIQDEVLAHRLGLIPLKADPCMFEYRKKDSTEFTEQDSLEFELKVKCAKNPNAPSDSSNPDDIYINSRVLSKDIKWIPIGSQGSVYKEATVGPVHSDILITKLRPGQELNLTLYAVKGIGRDHAKFSPVCTASYRLMPEVVLTRDVTGREAIKLKESFSPGVIELEERDGVQHAKVVNARYDMCSRNVFRHAELKDAVEMYRVKDHFIFTVESAGSRPPDALFLEAVTFLKRKCQMYFEDLKNMK